MQNEQRRNFYFNTQMCQRILKQTCGETDYFSI